MQAQQHANHRSRLADFSSALMRASAAEATVSQGRADTTAVRQPYRRDNGHQNLNLSNIISRITDDGPANLQVAPDVSHIGKTDAARSADAVADAGRGRAAGSRHEEVDQYAFAQSFAFDDPAIRNEGAASAGGPRSIWQQLVWLALIAAITVMGYFIYQLKMQAQQLQHAIDASHTQMIATSGVQQQQADVLPKLSSMDKALSAMQQELKGIKLDYQASDSKLASDIPRGLEPHLLEMAAASEIVSVLQDEFSRIQHEVDAMGSELRVMKKGNAPKQAVPPEQVESSPVPAKVPNLVVNLASLASSEKAVAAVDTLRQAGLSPKVQQVMVNGRMVYRISVDGFSTRDAAFAFIAEARKKYGFDGGWIRPF